MRITAWLRRLDVHGLAEVCRARAEVRQRPPETIEDLARLLSDPESVAAAVAGLDRDAMLVAQSVVVLGDGCEVARLQAFVRDPHGVLDAALNSQACWPGAGLAGRAGGHPAVQRGAGTLLALPAGPGYASPGAGQRDGQQGHGSGCRAPAGRHARQHPRRRGAERRDRAGRSRGGGQAGGAGIGGGPRTTG